VRESECEKQLSRIETDEHFTKDLLRTSRPEIGADVAAFRGLHQGM
jgi:hypothetical protein